MKRASLIRGLTLIELLSYLGLAGIVLLMLLLFLKSVIKQHVFVSERITVRQTAALVVRSLKRDATLSVASSVWTSSDGGSLLFQPASAVISSGSLDWSKTAVCYQHSGMGKSVRRWREEISEVSTTPIDSMSPHQFAQAELNSLEAKQPFESWGHIETFNVAKSGSLLVVSLSMKFVDSKKHEHLYNLENTILLRNGKEL